MALDLRDVDSSHTLAFFVYAVSGLRALEHAGVYMESAESRDEIELLGTAGVHGAISAVGAYGV